VSSYFYVIFGSITGFGFKGLASKPGYELETGFSFNGYLRLQYLTSMPGYDL